MKYVLDTNAVSALMRGDAAVRERLETLMPADVFVSQPTLAEIAFGIARLPDSKRKRWLQESLAQIESTLQRAAWTDEVTRDFGTIKAALERRGEPVEDFDIAIAAHALSDNTVLVTANRRHMRRIPGLVIEDWSA